jgi:RNA polymerase sigma-70 factor (ECF subfamily)
MRRTGTDVDPVAERAARDRFRALVADVVDPVRRYLWRRTDATTADEVLAETLVVLWRRSGEEPREVVPWAIGVARKQLANARRAAARRERLVARIAVIDPPGGSVPVADDADTGGDTDEAVRRVLARLRPGDAEVLRLWAWDELEPRQLADVLGISANAAAVRLHRARRRFVEEFGKDAGSAGQVEVKEGESR